MQPLPPDASETTAINCLKVRLFRRPASLPDRPPGGPTNFWVWGYFDWLDMQWQDSCLADFYNENLIHDPSGVSGKAKIDVTDPYFYEEQFLCAYTPDARGKIIGNEKPLLTITEVKLDDTILQSFNRHLGSDTYKHCKGLLENHLAKILPSRAEVDYQVFHSLGFSDLLIVFRSFSFQPVFSALFSIKNTPIAEGRYPVKSCYSIHGIDKTCITQWTDPNCERVSIKLSLKPGANVDEIKSEIENALSIAKNEKSGLEPAGKNGKSVKVKTYPLFGEYDTEILIEDSSSVSRAAQFFFGTKPEVSIFLPGNPFRNRLMNYTETRWDYPSLQPDHLPAWPAPTHEGSNGTASLSNGQVTQLSISFSAEPAKKFNNEFKNLWAATEFIIEKSRSYPANRLRSLPLGLRDILKIYWQIAHNDTINAQLLMQIHGILKRLMAIIICDMGVDKNEVNQALNTGCFTNLTVTKACEDNSLEKAIYLLSELLQNWVQATRMVLESPIYNIRYINSSAKIYICYNQIVEIIEEAFSKYFLEEDTPDGMYNFCAMIHHADQVKSELLFPDADTHQRLIPIRLDRNSFFSPSMSLPYLAHEIGHYISCNIQTRNEALRDTVCYDIARKIFQGVVIRSEYVYLFEEIYDSWPPEAVAIIVRIKDRLVQEIDEVYSSDSSRVDYQNPNFELYRKQMKETIHQVFGFHGEKVTDATQMMESAVNQFFKDDPGNPQNQRIQNLIYSLKNDIIEGKPITFATEFFESEISTIENNEAIKAAWENLISAYEHKKGKLEALAKDISTFILEGMNAESHGHPSLISILIDTAETPEKKKALAHFFSDRQIHENTQWNQKAVQKRVISDLAEVDDFLWFVDLYHDLFIETTADMLMIKTFNLSQNDYIRILDNNSSSNDPRDERRWLEPVKNIRKYILIQNWKRLVKKSPKKTDLLTDRSDLAKFHRYGRSIYQDRLIEYLSELSDRFRRYKGLSEIHQLSKQYNALRKNGECATDISKEIAFVEYYCTKCLDMKKK